MFKDLKNLVGKDIKIEELNKLLVYGKGELETYDEKTDEICVSFEDTNLPYLWSAEGVARLIRGVIGKHRGIPILDVFKKSEHRLIVDKSVSSVRPYIAAFVATGFKVDDYLIKQMIDLQEKFCAGYGRRRKKAAIGVYNYNKIKFPVHYNATDPESVKFVPLDFKKEMTQQEILEEHPTGKEYAWILEGQVKYPILTDDNNSVLSFPPIINSNYSGKIEIGDSDLFFEATGEDLDSVLLAANIFSQAFFDRGFKIYSVDVEYPDEKITTPFIFNESVRISKGQIKDLLGLELKDEEIRKLLEKMQYNFKDFKVFIPPYRRDIMHPVDIIEDIAIAYGYDNIEMHHLEEYTMGKPIEFNDFIDKIRDVIIGLGYQEIMSPVLSSKHVLLENMDISDFGTIEIEKPQSETYSAVRSWLLPIMIEILSKNKHVDYPQRIFEEGLVSVNKKGEAKDIHRVALVSAHANADFTEAKQALDALLTAFGVSYIVKETEHSSFITGRVGRVSVNGKEIAYVGEINPKVLSNFDLNVPVCGFELNLSELFELRQDQ